MRTCQHEQLAAETTPERDVRLQLMSALQDVRLAAESAAETPGCSRWVPVVWKIGRDTRLHQMRDRLAAETTVERDARLEYDRARHREQQTVQSQVPLFQQCSIQVKVRKFHANMATLDMPVCTTCSERFPGLQTQPSVCVVVVTNILTKYTPLITTWTLAPYYLNCSSPGRSKIALVRLIGISTRVRM